MKNIIKILLITLLSISLCACKTKTVNEDNVNEIAGAYTIAESPEITDDIKTLVEKANTGLLGVTYTPIAYIGSQVVSGTNHLILCKQEIVSANPVSKYVILEIYEDLNGEVEINEIRETKQTLAGEDLLGGYSIADSPVLTDEANKAITKATDGLVGCSYNPIALVATQVVSGTNYCILAKLTPVVRDADSHYSLVYVYEDLDGNAQITNVDDFTVLETDDNGYVAEYSSIEELNEILGARLYSPSNDVTNEKYKIYIESDGTKIGEYEYTLDSKVYDVRFCSNFTYSMTGVNLNGEELFNDPNADGFGEFSVSNALILYVAHWLTVDGQYAMICDTNELSEEDFTSIAKAYHDETIAPNY